MIRLAEECFAKLFWSGWGVLESSLFLTTLRLLSNESSLLVICVRGYILLENVGVTQSTVLNRATEEYIYKTKLITNAQLSNYVSKTKKY